MENEDKSLKHLEKTRSRETRELLEKVKSIFYYDHISGELRYKVDRNGGAYKGDSAGHMDRSGYTRVCLSGKHYMAHRIAWAIYYGSWPKHTIDHINQQRSANWIANLRDVTQSVNNKNKRKYRKQNGT